MDFPKWKIRDFTVRHNRENSEKLEIVLDSREKHTKLPRKTTALRIGSSLEFSKGGLIKMKIEYESKLVGNIKTDCKVSIGM